MVSPSCMEVRFSGSHVRPGRYTDQDTHVIQISLLMDRSPSRVSVVVIIFHWGFTVISND